MSLLNPICNKEFFSKQYYDRAIKECPKLATLSGQSTNDYMLTVLAFNLSYNSFYRGKRRTAIKLLHTVFNSPCADGQVYRSASLLEIQMCMELNYLKLARQLLAQLEKHPSWSSASLEQRECFELLSARCSPEPQFKMNSAFEPNGLHWFLLYCESQLKSTDPRTGLNALFKRRRGALGYERRLLDNAIGCVFAYHIKDCTMAESYFRSAMLTKDETDLTAPTTPIFSSTIIYHTALALLGSGKPRTAAFLFTSVLPFFNDNPRIWLRIAECCAYCKTTESLPIEASVLEKWASDGWNSMKNIMHDKGANLPESFHCNLELALYAIKQGLSIASPQPEFANLLPYFYSLFTFLNIRMKRYDEAIKTADELLNLPQINPRQKLMGLFYKAETLIYTNRLLEAIACLQQATPLQSISYTFSRIVYNRALLETLNGSYENSLRVLSELNNNSSGGQLVHRPEANLLRMYLDMRLRRMQLAKQIFKQRPSSIALGTN